MGSRRRLWDLFGLHGCKGNRMIRRLNRLSERHPLLSILVGFLALIVITLVVIPADPPSVDAAMHRNT